MSVCVCLSRLYGLCTHNNIAAQHIPCFKENLLVFSALLNGCTVSTARIIKINNKLQEEDIILVILSYPRA